jgi:hypothetical protein
MNGFVINWLPILMHFIKQNLVNYGHNLNDQ